MFHGGLSWAGGSSHMMANAGVTWKVGNRDAEAAVADRLPQRPYQFCIRSSNWNGCNESSKCRIKGEVSDLKYENEQIKAQTLVYKVK